ncbi:hypothetical protein QE152_g36257 [Popillia japonica]|uniref:Uncharacterized protein n=1 Tax=Popillia japonica TaxID=7064 RepID=A0AAW1IDJ4_POPJA
MGHNSPSGLYVLGRQRTRTAKKVCVVAGTSTSKMLAVLAAGGGILVGGIGGFGGYGGYGGYGFYRPWLYSYHRHLHHQSLPPPPPPPVVIGGYGYGYGYGGRFFG